MPYELLDYVHGEGVDGMENQLPCLLLLLLLTALFFIINLILLFRTVSGGLGLLGWAFFLKEKHKYFLENEVIQVV